MSGSLHQKRRINYLMILKGFAYYFVGAHQIGLILAILMSLQKTDVIYFSIINIYILIALALDESIILNVPQFPMQNIYQSCDLGRAIGQRNVNDSQ